MKKLCFALLLLPVLGHAAGFAFYDIGAAASGQANAYICRVDDPSAIWYNPAAIADLEGSQFSLNATWLHTEADFTSDLTTFTYHSQPQNLAPISAFYTHQFADGLVFGFGAYTPFVYKLEWPDNSIVSYLSETSKLRTLYFTPSVGYRISPNVSVGGGFDIVYADTAFTQNLSGSNYASRIDADTVDYGFNAAILIDTNSNLSLAMTYKSKIDLDLDGDVKFAGTFPGVPPPPRTSFPTGRAHITMSLPQQLTMGATTSYDRFDFEGDLIYVNWSRFETLTFEFDRNTVAFPDVVLFRNWENTWSVRLGTEYHVNDSLSVKGGYLHDMTPQPIQALDPIFVDANRKGLACGFTWKNPNWRFDFGYTHLFFNDRTSPLDNYLSEFAAGKYTQDHNMLSLGFTTRWD